jgi:hypothetical protein
MSEKMQEDSITDINEEQLEDMVEDVEVVDEEIVDEASAKKEDHDDDDEDEAEVEVDDDESEVEDEDEETEEKAKTKKEEVKVDFSDDLNALVEGEESLADGFKDKAALIFEAAISSKLKVEVARLEESYAAKLVEATESGQEALVEKVDSYLNYVVESWMKEHKLEVKSGLRTEIAESFMSSLYNVFVEHHVEVPESKVDLVDELAEQVEKLTAQLSESVDRGIDLSKSIQAHERADLIAEATVGMTEIDAEKFKGLLEDVEFVDTETFTSKIGTIKESYFKVKTVVPEEELLTTETVDDKKLTPSMSAYVDALNKKQTF